MNVTVELSDFDDDEILEYAKDYLGVVSVSEALSRFDIDELIKEVEGRGYVVIGKSYYPHNDIITTDLLQRINDNIGKIDNKELEEFLNSRGL